MDPVGTRLPAGANPSHNAVRHWATMEIPEAGWGLWVSVYSPAPWLCSPAGWSGPPRSREGWGSESRNGVPAPHHGPCQQNTRTSVRAAEATGSGALGHQDYNGGWKDPNSLPTFVCFTSKDRRTQQRQP